MLDSSLVSTAAGIFLAGMTAETPAIAAPFRKPLRLSSGPILGLVLFITVHTWFRSKIAVVVTGDDDDGPEIPPEVLFPNWGSG
jgi:hypothetical protein